MGYDDWIDEDEYPSERDMAAYGDDSPIDYDPLTVGYIGDRRGGFWSTRRIIITAIALLMLSALLLPVLLQFLS